MIFLITPVVFDPSVLYSDTATRPLGELQTGTFTHRRVCEEACIQEVPECKGVSYHTTTQECHFVFDEEAVELVDMIGYESRNAFKSR